jgi:hypothetical protein
MVSWIQTWYPAPSVHPLKSSIRPLCGSVLISGSGGYLKKWNSSVHHPDWCTGGVQVHCGPKTLNKPETHGVLKSWEEICVSASSRPLHCRGVLQEKRRGVFWRVRVQCNNCNEKYQKYSIRSDQRDAIIAIRRIQRMNCWEALGFLEQKPFEKVVPKSGQRTTFSRIHLHAMLLVFSSNGAPQQSIDATNVMQYKGHKGQDRNWQIRIQDWNCNTWLFKSFYTPWARVNQHPPVHQCGWMVHSWVHLFRPSLSLG